jgi:mono/diheme cytochrome c family protein
VQGQLAAPTGYGRIYRIVHDTTRRDRRPALSGATPEQLVGYLSHPNGWYRDTAQRLLVERNARGVAPLLRRLADETSADWRTRLHALWTLDGVSALEPATVRRALVDARPEIRMSALRLAERWLAESDVEMERAVLGLIDDTDWNVRQQVAATFGELPAGARVSAVARVLERYGDDPVVMDVGISGLRGVESQAIDRLLMLAADTPVRSAVLTMLAATVVRGGLDAQVQQLFGQIADEARPGWQRSALLAGAEVALVGAAMPGSPGRRGGGAPPAATSPARGGPGGPPAPAPPGAGSLGAASPGTPPAGARGGPGGARAFPGALEEGPPPPTALERALAALASSGPGRGGGRGGGAPLRLGREPALVSVAAAGGDLAARATAVLARVDWPGKPGAAAPLAPLSAAEARRFEAGRDLYAALCAACHQADGRGRPEVAPALVGSALALAPGDITARVLLNGKEGAVGLMPPLGSTLTDDQIAGVLTYIRREWGQAGSPVDPADAARARAASASRTRPWTDDELAAVALERVPSGAPPAGPASASPSASAPGAGR